MSKTTKRILKVVGWVVAIPLILLLLLFVALYIPPVQKWAVDLTADYLSKETGMEVSVERVRLKFPLDLSMGGVLMIAPPDTVLNAKELIADVRLLPLFKGEVMIDEVRLTDTQVNTLDLVESMQLQFRGKLLEVKNVEWNLNQGHMTVPSLTFDRSDLIISLADSVAEDTLEEEESSMLKTIDLKQVVLNDVGFTLNMAPRDSMTINTQMGTATTSARLDLDGGNYYVAPLKMQQTAINYDMGGAIPVRGFDPSHINLKDVNLNIDSLSYLSNGNLYVGIVQLSGQDRSGLQLDTLNGVFRMDNKALYLDQAHLKTPSSDLNLDLRMDMDTFSPDSLAGTLRVDANGTVGKSDLARFAADMADQFENSLPDRPITIALAAEGNMHQLDVHHLEAKMDGAFDFKGNAVLTNLMDPNGDIGIESRMDLSGQNLSFVKGFLPKDVASMLRLPAGMRMNGSINMADNQLKADATLNYGASNAVVKANYNMNNEAYDIDLTARNFNVNAIIALSDPCHLTGRLKAKGRGFDFTSPATYTDAKLNLEHVDYGTYYLDNTDMVASLKNTIIKSETQFGDERLDGKLIVEGTMNRKGVDADMKLDLPFSDLHELGLSADPLTAHATHGEFKASSNYKELFLMDAAIEGVEVVLKGDSLVTEKFDLHAETTMDSTSIQLTTSDMDFDFHSPNNLFSLMEDFSKVAETAQQQLEERSLNINLLKQMMPQTTLRASVGNQNPISKFLFMQGFRYEEVAANIRTSQEYGLQGNAHVYNFITNDSIKIDTVSFDLYQDTTQITYNVAVSCPEQEVCSAFTAYLDGFLSPHNLDSHLTFFNDKKEKGIDVGVRGVITTDSLLQLNLYPKQPIIAFRSFEVNDDNYIELYKKNRLKANVLMMSTSDSCSISVYANPVDSQLQNIEAVINNLNIEELLKVIPFAPQMAGLLNLSVNYIQTDEGFTVGGIVQANRFAYEGIGMGDLMTIFNYQPMGEEGHDINAMLYHDDEHIGIIKGNYNVTGQKHLNASLILDHLPLATVNPFITGNICALDGIVNGMVSASGPIDTLLFNGNLNPEGVHVYSEIYSFNLAIADEPISFNDSYITFNNIKILGAGQNPLTINGFVNFANLNNIDMNLSLYGQNFLVFDSSRTRKSALFGKLYGDFFARVNGTTNDLKIRGLVNVLSSTNITYIMTNTPLSVDYRLDDIVTFVDFSAPPPDASKREPRTFTGIDMQLNLEIEDGVQVRCEFSADKQSYVNVQGNGSMTMNYSPEGVINLLGRYTINEGEMKYTLPVIPLKTFELEKGSYIEFTGRPGNPTMNISATEQTKASVSNADGSSRSVLFNVGLRIFNTLENMGLEFTIDAPEDISVQNELAGLTAEEKNKLAVALLATGMYLSSTNENGFSTTNALNNFLQNEINNIAGKAVSSAVNVDMSVGMEQTKRDDGTTRTDYSFKFTKRFFSDRLNVVVGGRINADGNNNSNESGAYIDDISLEWRLDKGGTQYIRIFHDKNYENLLEGELTENGAGVVLRKKLDSLSELFIWKRKKNDQKK